MAAIDTHLKIDGVDGEATHKDHKNEIEVLSWSAGVTNSSNLAGGGSGQGKAEPHVFSFTHRYDKASPILHKKAAQGVHFASAVLTARKSGEGQKDFLKVTMTEVYITSVSPTGGGGGDLLENVTCSYGSIEYAYKPQDEKGVLGGEVKHKWNVKTTEIT